MIDNSSSDLFMLQAQVTVTVTGEEHHQQILGRYPVDSSTPRQVVVELGWCTINSGKYRGQQAIEVRLDGYRVGELTYAMSQRYGRILTAVATRGGRPGCEAWIHLGKRGVEIDLRLPRDPDTAVGTPAVVAQPRRGVFAAHKPAWIAAGVAGVLLIAVIGGQNEDSPSPTAGPVLPVTTTTSSTVSSTTPPPITTTPPAPPVALPAPVDAPPETVAVPPKPSPAATPPKRTPVAPPKPKTPVQPPASKCDPNYTGCVPIASDVDCQGGSGNGPAYVSGPINVIGSDIYDLDRDKDGIACE